MIAESHPLPWREVVESLPAINATLNGITTILLVVGFIFIRQGKWRAHGVTMLTATVVSALFLVGYVVHKFFHYDIRLAQRFPNLGAGWRYTYWFAILIPHLILAIVMLPFIFKGLWHASRREWRQHKLTNRWTVWIWLYVSVTGVLIYYLLYHLFPQLNGA